MKRPFKWLDSFGAIQLPPFTLVLSQEEFDAAIVHLGYRAGEHGDWCIADARSWFLVGRDGKRAMIVCLKDHQAGKRRHPCQTAALLAHEAVHVWQEFCREIGEDNPSDEFEAYGIQWISQQLFFEYARRATGHRR